jgi:hypothetical protein
MRGAADKKSRSKDGTAWTFRPPYPEDYARSASSSVLVLGPEPNGDRSGASDRDMGTFFRFAAEKNECNNRKFFRSTLFQVAAVTGSLTASLVRHHGGSPDRLAQLLIERGVVKKLRYVDIKSQEGGAKASRRSILEAARERSIELVRDYFLTNAPGIVVLQGSHVQDAFTGFLRDAMEPHATGDGKLHATKWVMLPHASAQAGYQLPGLLEAKSRLRKLGPEHRIARLTASGAWGEFG